MKCRKYLDVLRQRQAWDAKASCLKLLIQYQVEWLEDTFLH